MLHVSAKPTLALLRNQHYFDISALAEKAGVNSSIINRMLRRQPVQRYQAELVLTALTDELGQNYTLDTVDVVLAPEKGKGS
jgi:hypothetical protein